MIKEARNYCYKVDPNTNEILPIIVDAWNHGWDAVRYALVKYIKGRGGLAVWERLGDPNRPK
jgi:phage terminase large subunit